MIRLTIIAVCSLFFVGCSERQTEQILIEVPDRKGGAESLKKARVVGYRFALPGEGNDEEPVETGFSLIQEGGQLDFGHLNKLKKKESTLTSDQVVRLVDAIYGTHEKTGAAACYDPHHIFLFYDDSDALVNVVEVCFGCTNLHAQPDIGESQWSRHDFRDLVRLCDEIGIGMTSGTAEDFVRLWDERDNL